MDTTLILTQLLNIVAPCQYSGILREMPYRFEEQQDIAFNVESVVVLSIQGIVAKITRYVSYTYQQET